MRPRILFYAPIPHDPTSYYRCSGVLPFLKSNDYEMVDISGEKEFHWGLFTGASMLIMQRPFTDVHEAMMGLAKDCGLKLIADFDDDLFNVDQNNPTHFLYKQNAETLKRCIALCDEVWVSTPSIKKSFGQYSHNIHVIPNSHNDTMHPISGKRKFDPNGKKALYRGGSCFDSETEVLTFEGFKYFKDLTDNDWIATLKNGKTLVYNPIKQYFEFNYDGIMHHYKNKQIDCLITPNHKVYYATKKYGEYKLDYSENVLGKNIFFKKNCEWNGVEKTSFTIKGLREKEDVVWDIDDWLKFFGFWLADGWTWARKDKKTGQFGFALFKGDYVTEEICRILDKYNYHYTKRFNGNENFNSITCCDISLFTYLNQFGKASEKYIPKEIIELKRDKLKTFLEWFLKGDGSKESPKNRPNIRIRAYTSSKKLSDNLCEVAIKIGWAASVKNRGIREGGFIRNRKITQKHESYDISFLQDFENGYLESSIKGKDHSLVQYKGMVYCIEVENHIMYVRRGGRCYWSGNSHQADVNTYADTLINTINGNTDWNFIFMGDRYSYLEAKCGDNMHIVGGMTLMQYFKYLQYENPQVGFFPLCDTVFNRGKSNIAWLEMTFAGATFFGNTNLPEFKKAGIRDISELEKGLSEPYLNKHNNELSWELICDTLLLSKVNKVRNERLLSWV